MAKEELLKKYNEQINNKRSLMIAKMPAFSRYVDIIQMTEQEILIRKYNEVQENLRKLKISKEKLKEGLKRIELLKSELNDAIKNTDEARVKRIEFLIKNLENQNTSLQKELIIQDTELRQSKTVEEIKKSMLKDFETFDSLYNKCQTMAERNMVIINKKIEKNPEELADLVDDIVNYNFIKNQYKSISEIVNEEIIKLNGDRDLVYRLKEELIDYKNSINILDYFENEVRVIYDIELIELFSECFNNRRSPKVNDYRNLIKLTTKFNDQSPIVEVLKSSLDKYEKSKFKILRDLNNNGNLEMYNSLITYYDERFIFDRFNTKFHEHIYNNDITPEFIKEFQRTKRQNLYLIINLKKRINEMMSNEREKLIAAKEEVKNKYGYLEKPISFFEKFKGLQPEQIISKLADLTVINEEIELKDKIILLATRDAYVRGSEAINNIINNPTLLKAKVIKKKNATQK